jgi:hypothetical protein
MIFFAARMSTPALFFMNLVADDRRQRDNTIET